MDYINLFRKYNASFTIDELIKYKFLLYNNDYRKFCIKSTTNKIITKKYSEKTRLSYDILNIKINKKEIYKKKYIINLPITVYDKNKQKFVDKGKLMSIKNNDIYYRNKSLLINFKKTNPGNNRFFKKSDFNIIYYTDICNVYIPIEKNEYIRFLLIKRIINYIEKFNYFNYFLDNSLVKFLLLIKNNNNIIHNIISFI